MSTIVPFRGLRYNLEKVSDLRSVVTPPYDIIDETAQARYYAEDPANIIRLELGLIFPQDTLANNRYTRAAQYLQKWLESQILVAESRPAVYLYQQEFTARGETLTRTGMICGLKVEPYENGNILPHEETLSKPKTDRLYLMRSTQANFSSIFGLYSDEERSLDQLLATAIDGQSPDADLVDEAGEHHRLWVIDDPAILDKVIQIMADKKVYIADGHHRYETALGYAQEMADQGCPGFDYVMTTLVNLYDEGLVVLPTHRVVGNLPHFNVDDLLSTLGNTLTIQSLGGKKQLPALIAEMARQGEDTHVFGMYAAGELYLLSIKDFASACQQLPAEKSPAWKKLDVALLDNLILDQMLGIGERERRNQDNLAYSRDEEWVIEQVDNQNYQLGFFLNPTRVQEIVDVASARDKMPQKSTYFYPKLITGLVINHLETK